jgi:glycosyltransferase involved in cell wall biosynthesis
MRIAIFWTDVTANMAACWRALAGRPGVEVRVFVELSRQPDTAYRPADVLAGLDHRLVVAGEPLDRAGLQADIEAFRPDAMLVLGWRSRLCRFAAETAAFTTIPKLIAFDMPFAWRVRKLVAPWVLGRYLRRFRAALVAGERSASYARYLGFRPERIEQGMYGVDADAFAAAARARPQGPAYPRRFLYVGRYVREKRLDVLVAAYERYRKIVADPWELSCCGMGPLHGQLTGVTGLTDLGFVQPVDLPGVLARHGAFVIASDYEPWGFAIAEAVAAGLPVICTTACGAGDDLVRSGVSGRVVPPGDVPALAAALAWIHAREADLPAIGATAAPLLAPFTPDAWAERVGRLLNADGWRRELPE